MTRTEQVVFCNVCVYQKKDFEQGNICALTDRVGVFEVSCQTYEGDIEKQGQFEERSAAHALDSKLASQGQRFANYIIDYIFIIGLGALIGVLLGLVLGHFAPNYLAVLDQENRILNYLYGFTIGIVYYSFFEGFTGRTMGKFFTKTKVVTEEGDKPDFGTVVVRSICRYIPFNHFSFLSVKEPGWHDKLSKTRVVTIN